MARSFLLFWLVTAVSSGAAAQVSIAAPACEGLDLPAIERAVAVEIGDVAAEWRELSAPVVLLGCAGDRVRIEITDPVTDKSVARIVAMPEIDRERVIALAIAQLFLTSWLELLLDVPWASPGPGAEEAERRAREAALPDAPVEPEVVTPTEPAPTELVDDEEPVPAPSPPPGPALGGEVSLEGGPRWREAGEELVTAFLAARLLLVVDRTLAVSARVGFEWGRAERTRGSIDVTTIPFGLVAALRTPELGPLFLEGSLSASLVVLALTGRPRGPDVAAGATVAIAAEGLLELAPSLRFGPVVVGVPLAIGAMAFAPDGQVSGEPPVVTNGLVLAGSLRVSLVPEFW